MSNKKESEIKQEKNNSNETSTNERSSNENQNSQENKNPEDLSDVEKDTLEQQVQKETEDSESIDDLKKSLNAEKERYLRLMAEFDNYKKRVSRDYERLVESANEKIMLEMVDVRENFDRAMRSSENADSQSILDGFKLIFNKFESVLQKNGLEIFASIGEPFDPQFHDAMMKTVHDSIPEDHIADVYEKGYKLKGKVIKHAKVIVSSGNC